MTQEQVDAIVHPILDAIAAIIGVVAIGVFIVFGMAL